MPKSVKDIAEGPFVSRGFSDFESTMQKITADRKEITAALEAATKEAEENAAIMNANRIAVKELIQTANDEMSKWKKTAEEANKQETNIEEIEEVLSKKTKLNELLDKTLLQLSDSTDSTDLSQKEFFSDSDFLKLSESKREIERKKDELSKLETALRDKLLPKESKGKGLTKKRKSTRRRRSRRHRKSTRRRRRKY